MRFDGATAVSYEYLPPFKRLRSKEVHIVIIMLGTNEVTAKVVNQVEHWNQVLT